MIFSRVKIPKLIAYWSLNLVSRRDLNISKIILQTDIYLFTDGYGYLKCEIVSFSLTNKFLIFFLQLQRCWPATKGFAFLMI